MSVLFSSEPLPDDPRLAELWQLLEAEYFEDAMNLGEAVCRDPNAPIEFFCGLSLAYGESGYYADAENVARTAIGFGESHWRARHALAVSLLHQGRLLGALDGLGFYRTPPEIYVVRAQIEKMGHYIESLQVTLEDALDQEVPPAIRLYLAYLYASSGDDMPKWRQAGLREMARWGDYLDVWERDLARHADTPYGEQLTQHISDIKRLLG